MWWIKHDIVRHGVTLPVAQGPWNTETEAQAMLDLRSDADDPGALVEADASYPHTLKHPVGKMASGDGQDNIVYSDGSMTPIE